LATAGHFLLRFGKKERIYFASGLKIECKGGILLIAGVVVVSDVQETAIIPAFTALLWVGKHMGDGRAWRPGGGFY
jgi:hypothetical protein